ncbi:MAG: septum site-determining protein MinC [Cyanobacteria bacterium P01_C01_bin.118]
MDNGAGDNLIDQNTPDSPSETSSIEEPKPEADGHTDKDTPSSRAQLAARLKTSKDVELYVFEEGADDAQNATRLADVESLELDIDQPESSSRQQITFKSEQGRLLLMLPPAQEKSFTAADWEDLCQQLRLRLSSGDRFLQPNTTVHLIARDRLLDSRQLQEIDQLLQNAKLQMKRIYTQRRQTAVAAATSGYSVEQRVKLDHFNDTDEKGKALDTPLYLHVTVRSGVEIRHPGSVIVLGDVNPGGSVIAAGDIFVWGRLRGVAHAGADGNEACRIMTLHMQPTQLRIAGHVARAPEKPPAMYEPEVAYVSRDGIRIAIASEFAQIHLSGA